MDPCCGSGHFLVEAFHAPAEMRMEEEGLDAADGRDAVLRDNLFGLELDPRCVQIAAFALAFAGLEGWRLPRASGPEHRLLGIPARGTSSDWKASVESRRRRAMTAAARAAPRALPRRRHPRQPHRPRAKDSELGDGDDLEALVEALGGALGKADDPVSAVFGSAVAGAARAARLLARRYTLVATNVPYLAVRKQGEVLRRYCERRFPEGRMDLATSFLMRLRRVLR